MPLKRAVCFLFLLNMICSCSRPSDFCSMGCNQHPNRWTCTSCWCSRFEYLRRCSRICGCFCPVQFARSSVCWKGLGDCRTWGKIFVPVPCPLADLEQLPSNPFLNGTLSVDTAGIDTNVNCSNPSEPPTLTPVSGSAFLNLTSKSVQDCVHSVQFDPSVRSTSLIWLTFSFWCSWVRLPHSNMASTASHAQETTHP